MVFETFSEEYSRIDLTCIPDDLIICDGSCLRNPGPGGWALIHVKDGRTSVRSGSSPHTTNNIMELTAAIESLILKPCFIYTDSSYVVNGINSWIHTWKRNGWKNSQREVVKNLELWQKITSLHTPNTQVKWIKGHASLDVEDPAQKAMIQLQHAVDLLARQKAHG